MPVTTKQLITWLKKNDPTGKLLVGASDCIEILEPDEESPGSFELIASLDVD